VLVRATCTHAEQSHTADLNKTLIVHAGAMHPFNIYESGKGIVRR